MDKANFEWNETKNIENQGKQGVSFYEAQYAFLDPKRIIAEDLGHSREEKRYFCCGMNQDFTGVLTVRFRYRKNRIRIFGAGYWRKGKKVYEQANSVSRWADR